MGKMADLMDGIARHDAEARAKADPGEATLSITLPLKVWRMGGLGGAWVVESDWLPAFATRGPTKADALNAFCLRAGTLMIERARATPAVTPVAASLAQAAPALVGALVELEWIDDVCRACGRNRAYGHAAKCPVDTALTTAGLGDAGQREEARDALRSIGAEMAGAKAGTS